jgi:cytochrome c oxidase subunit 4
MSNVHQPYKKTEDNEIRPEAVPGEVAIKGNYETHHEDHHIVPMSTYYKIFGALMVLLILTVLAAEVEMNKVLGENFAWMNIIIALAIAFTKAILIVLYFMHVKFSSRLIMVFAFMAYFFVGIMFMMTYADYMTRDWLPGWLPQALPK